MSRKIRGIKMAKALSIHRTDAGKRSTTVESRMCPSRAGAMLEPITSQDTMATSST